jgi:hypothetical protein
MFSQGMVNMNRLDVEERPGVSVGLEHLSLREEPLSVFVDAAAAGGAETMCLSVAHPGVHVRLDGLRRKLDVLAELGAPGDGEFPLEEVLSLLSRGITVSAEVPLRSLKQVGIPPEERARQFEEDLR